MDETITGQPTDNTGAQALPVPAETPAAQVPEQAQVTTPTQGEQSSLPETDEKLVKFAASHGLELDSPSAIKAAKIALDNQASYQQAQQKASQLDKSLQTPQVVGEQTEITEFIQDYRREKQINSFKESTPDWKEHESSMVEKLSEQVSTPYGVFTRSELVNHGLLTLSDVYAMAKGSQAAAPQQDVSNVLQSIANKQMAGSNQGNAVNSAPNPANEDPFLAGIKRNRENS